MNSKCFNPVCPLDPTPFLSPLDRGDRKEILSLMANPGLNEDRTILAVYSPIIHRLLLGFALLHLVLATVLPMMFFESHYALYGYYPQPSYVDHPPLIGWLQWLMQRVSDSDFALRVIPVGLTLLTQYVLIAIAQRLYVGSPRVGVSLAWLLQLLPITHIAFVAAPDLALALFVSLGFWFMLDIVERDSWTAWLGLGACFGLAGLSKYTAVTLVVSLPLALWIGGHGWRWLLTPKPWVAGALAAILIGPVIYWNLQNDWLSFTFQMGYQTGDQAAGQAWSLAAFARALGIQLVTYSPLILVPFFFWRPSQNRTALLLCLSWGLPVFALFLYQVGAGRTSPHWTYAAWLSLSPALAWWMLQHWSNKGLRWLVYGWGATLGLITLVAIALPWIPFDDYKHPLQRYVGWQEASLHGVELNQAWQTELDSQAPGQNQSSLLVYNWHYAEPVAWYARPAVVRDALNETSQYSQWFGTWKSGDKGLLIMPDISTTPEQVHIDHVACQPVDQLPVLIGNKKAQVFHYYRCVWN